MAFVKLSKTQNEEINGHFGWVIDIKNEMPTISSVLERNEFFGHFSIVFDKKLHNMWRRNFTSRANDLPISIIEWCRSLLSASFDCGKGENIPLD